MTLWGAPLTEGSFRLWWRGFLPSEGWFLHEVLQDTAAVWESESGGGQIDGTLRHTIWWLGDPNKERYIIVQS